MRSLEEPSAYAPREGGDMVPEASVTGQQGSVSDVRPSSFGLACLLIGPASTV